MAQVKATYEPLEDFSIIAKKIAEKYPEDFGQIETQLVRAVVITNKDRGEKKKELWTVKGVPLPISLDCPYRHYVIIHASDWEGLAEKHKNLLVAQILLALPNSEEDENKVNPFDMKDFAKMLRTFGTDYLVKDEVPDILADQIKWASA